MKAMKNKIKSQRGASITFALLLFLVCAVVSIVVVVAGSAAAGRMSQRAETDQRYYAVTSAVELLCDDFKDMIVTVEYSKTPSVAGAGSDLAVTKIIEKDDTTETDVKDLYPVLKAVSEKLVEKIANNASSPTIPDDTLQLTANGAPTGSLTACTIKEYVFKDGRVIFEVSNADVPGAEKQNKYTLQAVFDANITQSKSQYTESGNQMERVITTLEWSVDSIRKGAK